jgi:hypothetical protein
VGAVSASPWASRPRLKAWPRARHARHALRRPPVEIQTRWGSNTGYTIPAPRLHSRLVLKGGGTYFPRSVLIAAVVLVVRQPRLARQATCSHPGSRDRRSQRRSRPSHGGSPTAEHRHHGRRRPLRVLSRLRPGG